MDTRAKLGLAIGILALILIALAGCQTLGGACRDLESAARYGHEHIICEE